MGKKYDFVVFIARMQPPHKAHIANITKALDLGEKVIVIFGSDKSARTIKNPFTLDQRKEMVLSCFDPKDHSRFEFIGVRDYFYNDNVWVTDVQQQVNQLTEDDSKIALVGTYKDHSSYYLDLFPQWKRESLDSNYQELHATDIRNMLFDESLSDVELRNGLLRKVDLGVFRWLLDWKKNSAFCKSLSEEWKYIKDYKAMWAQAPFPVIFTTTDAVIVKSGHVLMIRRKFNPGKGLLALPGGFLKQDLSIIDSALEEVKEETRIHCHKDVLKKNVKAEKVFDHPNRSERGRTVTHAFYIELPPGGELPRVKGDDDAERAVWIPIADLFAKEGEVYEDHIHIVSYFVSKAR